MTKKIPPICKFENKKIIFESYINEFTPELYKEFDRKADNLSLHSKIDDLLNGNKVNYTENLAAWHPKYRQEYDPVSLDTPSNKNQRLKLSNLDDLCKAAQNVVSIGIGGSFEGPKMFLESIELGNENTNFIFITGSDLSEFRIKTKKLNPNDTIFVVSSKSFKTEETISILKHAILWSGEIDRFIAITANKDEAKKYNLRNIIEFDQEIVGRYSIWSEISALIFSLKKEQFDAFMAGGKQADFDLKKNKAYLKFVKNLAYSDIWLHNFKKKYSRVVLTYAWNLRSFPSYIQQLEMESLGKQPSKDSEFKNTGQIIFGGYGPRAQHSYFQLLHQGTQDICADIVVDKEYKKTLAYAQAISQSKLMSEGADALKEHEKINGNIPTNIFFIDSTSSYDLGYLLATWEHRTYITSVMLDINPFDQFGVNAGKIYTKKYLSNKD